jgi:hypothetical protein
MKLDTADQLRYFLTGIDVLIPRLVARGVEYLLRQINYQLYKKFHSRLRQRPSIMVLEEKPRYRSVLIEFMSFRDGQAYAQNTEFTDLQLAEITPSDLTRWFCLKAYGVADPAPNANPTVGRSSSLEFYKKALSYYMPNRLQRGM